ncbi:hepatic lectin-like [Sander lucioperca]|uniref:hepatic lectin-like n=1 Tax=Sander lucioperca TaxID=283035 RepID=UPI00125D5D39|nr:hepatic lectin-like [Sander lucioperca]XP_035847614.1 hepatic lectin-like [Sander lucioperca]
MSHPQDYRQADAPTSQQHSVPRGGSKVTSERVALFLLSALLAAAAIVICRLSFDNLQNKKSLQTLRDEHEAMKRNLTDEPCQKREGGWELHGGKCDYFSTDRLSWELSRNLCKEQHGDLVKIDSREEQTFLELKLREKMNEDEDKFWIGLTDSETEGTWLWADGSPLDTSLTFWSSGETEPEPEPDNWTGEDPDGEDCVRMGEKGRAPDLKCWFDKSCKEPQRCICEKEATAAHLKCV